MYKCMIITSGGTRTLQLGPLIYMEGLWQMKKEVIHFKRDAKHFNPQ